MILLPFFKFYVNDWLNSEKIAFMTHAQVGAYIMLLAKCWTQPTCTLPGDARLLIALIQWKGTADEFVPVLACFESTKKPAGRLMNPRLSAEWEEAQQRAAVWRESGQRGAAKRWTPLSRPISNGMSYEADAKVILHFLNEKTGKHFRENAVNLNFIIARLKSGVDCQTCKSLIARKVRDWSAKPDMLPYLRPETLFNKTKFETYLAEVTS